MHNCITGTETSWKSAFPFHWHCYFGTYYKHSARHIIYLHINPDFLWAQICRSVSKNKLGLNLLQYFKRWQTSNMKKNPQVNLYKTLWLRLDYFNTIFIILSMLWFLNYTRGTVDIPEIKLYKVPLWQAFVFPLQYLEKTIQWTTDRTNQKPKVCVAPNSPEILSHVLIED